MRKTIASFFQWLADLSYPRVTKASSTTFEEKAVIAARAKRDLDRLNNEIAIEMANEMQKNWRYKRDHPEELSIDDQIRRNIWLKNRTPKEECKHMKGPDATRWGLDIHADSRNFTKDYNLSVHTFIDGRTQIKCLWNCGFEVWSDTTDRKLWDEAKSMAKMSTNKPSSSEIPENVLRKKGLL